MQVEELVAFIHWVDKEIRTPNITNLYKQLFNSLNQNTQPNHKEPFEQQKDALIEGVMNINIHLLNDAQTRFADHIGLLDLVGEKAKIIIEDILYKNVIDIATSAQRIKEQQNSLENILQNLHKVSEGLSDYIELILPEYEEALVHIRFQHDSSINNIVDLNKWGKAWFEIGRGIALVDGLPPEDIKIIGASRGSIIYDMAVVYSIAHTLTAIILNVLKVAERVLDIRLKAKELRSMNLSNNKAADELDKESKKVEEEGLQTVLNAIKEKKNIDGEKENALSLSISKIFEFISGGGEIDVHIEEEAEDSDDENEEQSESSSNPLLEELINSYKEIKQLKKKILLLKENND